MFCISSASYCFISLCLILFHKAHRIVFFQISMRLSTIWENRKWNLLVVPNMFFLIEINGKENLDKEAFCPRNSQHWISQIRTKQSLRKKMENYQKYAWYRSKHHRDAQVQWHHKATPAFPSSFHCTIYNENKKTLRLWDEKESLVTTKLNV